MENETLPTCPFCGGKAREKNNEDWDKTYDGETLALIDCSPSEADHFWIECELCQCATRICGTEEEARIAWRLRVRIIRKMNDFTCAGCIWDGGITTNCKRCARKMNDRYVRKGVLNGK